jgi:hypothetical protein
MDGERSDAHGLSIEICAGGSAEVGVLDGDSAPISAGCRVLDSEAWDASVSGDAGAAISKSNGLDREESRDGWLSERICALGPIVCAAVD